MKKVILFIVVVSCLLAAGAVNSEVIASAKTKTGRMFLTDSPCPNKTSRFGFIASSVANTLSFCWSYEEETDEVYVLYTDGDLRMYPGEEFTMNTDSKAYKEAMKEESGKRENFTNEMEGATFL